MRNICSKFVSVTNVSLLVFAALCVYNSHHVHRSCHWKVKGVEGGLVLDNSFIPKG